MTKDLKRTYFTLLIPAVLLLSMSYGAKRIDLISTPGSQTFPTFIAPCFFVLSVLSAVALPIFIRSLFAHTMRKERTIPEAALIQFEKKLIIISLLTPYFIIPAYLLEFPYFYFTSIVLMALYALYYFYPSKKRVQFERRLFRVR